MGRSEGEAIHLTEREPSELEALTRQPQAPQAQLGRVQIIRLAVVGVGVRVTGTFRPEQNYSILVFNRQPTST